MNKKLQKIDKTQMFRLIIQCIFLFLLPETFNEAFGGVKYIFNQLGQGKEIELSIFVVKLIALCMYTFIFGRFFCGYGCAFGTLGDLSRRLYTYICKKRKKRSHKLKENVVHKLMYLKYVILLGIVMMCFTSCYSYTKGMSPWDVFSMITVKNFNLTEFKIGLIILIAVLVITLFEERAFCKFLCPMGAVFSLLPVLPLFTLHRNRKNCIPNCKGCIIECPSHIALDDKGSVNIKGDCIMCGKCINKCSKGNVSTDIKFIKGNEISFVLLRALILIVILYLF